MNTILSCLWLPECKMSDLRTEYCTSLFFLLKCIVYLLEPAIMYLLVVRVTILVSI